MANHYAYGRGKELQVGEFFERLGYTWRPSYRSQGPFDIRAERGREIVLVQVKATRREWISDDRLTLEEEDRMIAYARRVPNSVPLLALVARNYLWLLAVPGGQLVEEGQLTRLEYEYDDR